MPSVRCTASALILRSLPDAEPTTDTGRRFIRNQVAPTFGLSHDASWLYIDAPAGRGWVSGQYTEPALEIGLPLPAWPRVPNGLAQIIELYGKPGSAICAAGRVRLPAALKLSWQLATEIRVFACHKLLEDVFESVFNEIHARGLWHLLEDFGGCYNYREVKASTRVSTHAWGASVDLNTLSNPLGAVPKMDPRITAIFRDHSFVWGGVWTRPDGMHYQRASGY